MKSFLLLFATVVLLLSATDSVQAQRHGNRSLDYSSLYRTHFYRGPYSYNFGLGMGAMRGDFCGRPSCNFWGRYISLGMSYPILPGIRLGGDLEYFRLGATESRPQRNISFRGENVALVGYIRINLRHDPGQFPGNPRARTPIFMPYAKLGVGGLVFNPTTYVGRNRYSAGGVETLPAETDYPGFALTFPMGGGMAIRLSQQVSLTPELMYHITTTDYLDNTRIHPSHSRSDHYGIATVKLQITPKKNLFERKRRF